MTGLLKITRLADIYTDCFRFWKLRFSMALGQFMKNDLLVRTFQYWKQNPLFWKLFYLKIFFCLVVPKLRPYLNLILTILVVLLLKGLHFSFIKVPSCSHFKFFLCLSTKKERTINIPKPPSIVEYNFPFKTNFHSTILLEFRSHYTFQLIKKASGFCGKCWW